jgi:hypothetical protein
VEEPLAIISNIIMATAATATGLPSHLTAKATTHELLCRSSTAIASHLLVGCHALLDRYFLGAPKRNFLRPGGLALGEHGILDGPPAASAPQSPTHAPAATTHRHDQTHASFTHTVFGGRHEKRACRQARQPYWRSCATPALVNTNTTYPLACGARRLEPTVVASIALSFAGAPSSSPAA